MFNLMMFNKSVKSQHYVVPEDILQYCGSELFTKLPFENTIVVFCLTFKCSMKAKTSRAIEYIQGNHRL